MKYRLLALGVISLFAAQAARADVVVPFDTYTGITPYAVDGPTTASPGGSGPLYGDGVTLAAQSFSVPSAWTLNTITLNLSADTPSDGGAVLVYLLPDDGSGNAKGVAGAPVGINSLPAADLVATIADSSLVATGSVIGSGGPSAGQLTTVNLTAANIPSTADEEYWVVLASAGSSFEWYYNADDTNSADLSPGAVGTANQLVGNNLGGPWATQAASNGAYSLDTSATASVPEPATIAVLGVGLAGLGFSRRRKIG